jgi:NADP-dependent aldehyde dehydrogenase
MNPEDGRRLVSHPLVGGIGFTGSRAAGLQLKAAADAAGKPIYLEMSSVNPVFILPGALRERGEEIGGEFFASCTLGTGQFCTNPGLVFVVESPEAERFLTTVAGHFGAGAPGLLLSAAAAGNIASAVEAMMAHGASIVARGRPGSGFSYPNTLLRVSGSDFLGHPDVLQTEAFGPVSLVVVATGPDQLCDIVGALEGSLTGSFYAAESGSDDHLYRRLEPLLRPKVGRLLNDKMPTGVAVVSAMTHGGPFPATGHPGFTAVGFPAAIRRFAALRCYDNVRKERLPPELRDANPTGDTFRLVDGEWTTADIPAQETGPA